jgi:hypothetical protein
MSQQTPTGDGRSQATCVPDNRVVRDVSPAVSQPNVQPCKGPSLDESAPCPDDMQLRQLSSGEGATRCTSCGVEAFQGIKLER